MTGKGGDDLIVYPVLCENSSLVILFICRSIVGPEAPTRRCGPWPQAWYQRAKAEAFARIMALAIPSIVSIPDPAGLSEMDRGVTATRDAMGVLLPGLASTTEEVPGEVCDHICKFTLSLPGMMSAVIM